MRDPENCGDVGDAIEIRHRVDMRPVEQHRERHTKLFGEGCGLFGIVLRNAHQRDVLAAISSVQTLQEWKGVLACGTGDFEKGEDYRTAGKFVGERESGARCCVQFELGGLGSKYER